ncbi:MAG: HAD family hydrolase [Beijerinckiaceae bacterium]
MTADGVIKGVLFDKDGTIFDFQKSWAPINLEAARHASGGDDALRRRLLEVGGVDPATGYARADGLMAAGNAAEIAEAWISAGCRIEQAALTSALDDIFFDGAANMVPAADLPVLMDRLAGRGFKLGIASSDSEAGVRAAAELFGIAPFMSFLCGYDSGHGHKPEAGMALAFCRACGLKPSEIAVVGDSAHDMEMGRRAGVALRIGVLTGAGTRKTLAPHADAVVDSIADIERLLRLS